MNADSPIMHIQYATQAIAEERTKAHMNLRTTGGWFVRRCLPAKLSPFIPTHGILKARSLPGPSQSRTILALKLN